MSFQAKGLSALQEPHPLALIATDRCHDSLECLAFVERNICFQRKLGFKSLFRNGHLHKTDPCCDERSRTMPKRFSISMGNFQNGRSFHP